MIHFNVSGVQNNLRDRNKIFSTENFGNNGARKWKRPKIKPRLQAAGDC